MNCSMPGLPVITNSRSSLRLTSTESVMPSSHLILCRPLLLLPPTPPSIRVFSNESALHMRWPKYWSFSFSISPSNEYSRPISFRMDWLDLVAVQGTLKSLLQHHSSKASASIVPGNCQTSKALHQFSCSVMSNSLQPHGLQPTRPPCPYFLEFAQTRVQEVSDAIRPSHPLSSLSFLPSIFPSISLFK